MSVLHPAPLDDVSGDGSSDPGRRALVEAARAGDAEAWNEIYAQVYPRLRAYVVRRCGRYDAEDLVSETMTRALQAIGRFRWKQAGFEGWLFGIARHVTADHHRRLERARRHDPRIDPSDARFAAPGEGSDLADDHAELRRAFACLPKADRDLLELRVVGGLSAEQTAAALGKRPGAVRVAQSRALARLRITLEAQS